MNVPKKPSLLEQALSYPSRKPPESKDPLELIELIELAIAFSRNEVSSGQIAKAIGRSSNNTNTQMAYVLLRACRTGYLKVVRA